MRGFVTEHPEYKHDSVVSERIAYDLLKTCHEISNKGHPCPKLFGSPETLTTRNVGPCFEFKKTPGQASNGQATNGQATNGPCNGE
jgi:hypothetical protein